MSRWRLRRKAPAITQLIELGKERGYVTIDDILQFFPEAEQDVEQLDEVYEALLGAGVQYLDDVDAADKANDGGSGEDDDDGPEVEAGR